MLLFADHVRFQDATRSTKRDISDPLLEFSGDTAMCITVKRWKPETLPNAELTHIAPHIVIGPHNKGIGPQVPEVEA